MLLSDSMLGLQTHRGPSPDSGGGNHVGVLLGVCIIEVVNPKGCSKISVVSRGEIHRAVEGRGARRVLWA